MARSSRLLSAREESVVELVARGFSNGAISDELALSIKTVEKHVAAAFVKFGVRSRTQLAATYTRQYQGSDESDLAQGAAP